MQNETSDNQFDDETHDGEFSLSSDYVRAVEDALDKADGDLVRELLSELHAADVAELFNVISLHEREQLLGYLEGGLDPEVLTRLTPEVRDDILSLLGAEKSAVAISQLETDDAVHIIEDLSAAEQREILDAVPIEAREEIIESLTYPLNSAGRLMRPEFVAVPEFWSVGDTIDYLRSGAQLPTDFYVIFVMDPRFRPVGYVLLSRIMQNKRDVRINAIMNPDIHTMPTHMDQEETANIFRKYALVEAPVVNGNGRLVGTITVDDVVDVIQEEGEEDILRLGGVAATDFHAPAHVTAMRRFWWLFINFITAGIASFVISRFSESIEQLVALAVLMPVIASMGGNAGIQTVTVAVRAITTRELQPTNAMSVLFKEVLVGGMNGFLLGIIAGVGVALLFGNLQLAFVFGLAMLINMLVAGFAGVMIPLVFVRLKLDPAIASGVFLTMFTDVTGFFSFLGLATFTLLHPLMG